ncbi:DUF3039 domain-containing protein [Microbacterium aurantiacum]|uniref:DUF3039 domain-containing protein n=1 Tax=Microbacterium aurantiacum TaxID=162393 RepID=UPI001CA4A733|nr:DUF3039 domain-containing protein [Microbacterium aurantiacum]
MRPVRPTLRVLRHLNRADFNDPTVVDIVAQAAAATKDQAKALLELVSLSGLTHPLLDDAETRFRDGGMPDRHKASTKTHRAAIYEVRDRVGAAWRGAVALDEHGDPWLVYADTHDEFHDSAPVALRRTITSGKVDRSVWEPSPLDYRIRERDDAERAKREFLFALLHQMLEGLGALLTTGEPVKLTSPEYWEEEDPRSLDYTLSVEHDEPAASPAHANTTTSSLDVAISLSSGNAYVRDQLINAAVVFLQPDKNLRSQDYRTDGTLVLSVMLTHAHLAALLAEVESTGGRVDLSPPAPTHRHYLAKDDKIRSFVDGGAVVALCGHAYVVSEGENADLPICGTCESVEPVAQDLLDRIRELNARTR